MTVTVGSWTVKGHPVEWQMHLLLSSLPPLNKIIGSNNSGKRGCDATTTAVRTIARETRQERATR